MESYSAITPRRQEGWSDNRANSGDRDRYYLIYSFIVHLPVVSNMHNCTAAVLPRPSHVWEEDCGHVDGAALHLVAVGITVSAVGTPSVCTGICVN